METGKELVHLINDLSFVGEVHEWSALAIRTTRALGTPLLKDVGDDDLQALVGGTYSDAAKDVYYLRSHGFTSLSEADAYRRYDALHGGAGGRLESHPEGVRPENTGGEGARSTGSLFGDTSFDFGALTSRRRRGAADIKTVRAEAEALRGDLQSRRETDPEFEARMQAFRDEVAGRSRSKATGATEPASYQTDTQGYRPVSEEEWREHVEKLRPHLPEADIVAGVEVARKDNPRSEAEQRKDSENDLVNHWVIRRMQLQDTKDTTTPERFEAFLREHPEYAELWESMLDVMGGGEPKYGRPKFAPKEAAD
jgi:hypothetical protein